MGHVGSGQADWDWTRPAVPSLATEQALATTLQMELWILLATLTLRVTDHQVVTLLDFPPARLFRQLDELHLVVDEGVMLDPADVDGLDPAVGVQQVLREDVQDAGDWGLQYGEVSGAQGAI